MYMYHCKIYFTDDWWPWRRELELENDTEKHSIGRDEWTIGKKQRVDERLSDCFTINRPLYTMSYFLFPSPFRQRPLSSLNSIAHSIAFVSRQKRTYNRFQLVPSVGDRSVWNIFRNKRVANCSSNSINRTLEPNRTLLKMGRLLRTSEKSNGLEDLTVYLKF